MAAKDLKELLAGVKNRDDASGAVGNKEAKIKQRAKVINELFESVTTWLAPSVADELATVNRHAFVHFDDVLGDLTEESLELVVGASTVFFAPRVGRIAGALVRVDMSEGTRSVPLIYLADRGWHILLRGAVTQTEKLTEVSFVALLSEMLG